MIGSPSTFKLTRKASAVTRVLLTFVFRETENAARYGKGQPVAQPLSHEPFWHPNERYKYRDGLPSHPVETSCKDGTTSR